MILEAEKGLIAGLINIEDFANTLPIKLNDSDFFDHGSRIISRVVFKLHSEGQETITKNLIMATAKDMNLMEFNGLTDNGELVDELCNMHPSKEEAIQYLKQVKKESLRFSFSDKLKVLKSYVETTEDTLSKIMAKCEDVVLEITTSSDHEENKLVRLDEGLHEFIFSYGLTTGSYGLDIGFKEWQDRVGGVAGGKIHMFIATFKTGKSTIGQRAALLLARQIPVLLVDTEMTVQEQKERLFCQFIKMPYDIFLKKPWQVTGTPEFNQWYHVVVQGEDEFQKISHNITYLDANNKSVPEMLPAMRRWAIQNKVCVDARNPQGLIIYDYVKLAASDELIKAKIAEWQKLGLDIGALKAFANKYKVPVLTFGQTNREDDSTVKCLGASKRIGDNVDSLTLFKEKTPEILMKDPTGTHLLRIFVTRAGCGTRQGEHINVDFDKAIGNMQELDVYTPSAQPPVQSGYKGKGKAKSTGTATFDELMEDQFQDDDD